MNKAEKVIEMMDGMKPWLWLVAKLGASIKQTPLGTGVAMYAAESRDSGEHVRSATIQVWKDGSFVDMVMRPESREEPSIERHQLEHPEIYEVIDRAIQIYARYQEAVKLLEEHRTEVGEIHITKTKVEWVADKLTKIEEECLCNNWIRKDKK